MARGSRLGRRLLLLHLLLLLLPIGGMLYLRSFERRLLEREERAMVAEARWIAAALAHPRLAAPGAPIAPEAARELLRARVRPLDARVRVVGADGRLLADTVPFARPARRADFEERGERRSWLYRAGASVWSFFGFLNRRERPRYASEPAPQVGAPLDTPEVARALAGGYGAATRLSSDGRFLVLSSAVPVASGGRVVGAVLVSRTTLGVLAALDRVRLDVFRVLVACLAVALAVSVVFSRALVAPLVRLRDQAERLLDARGRIARRFSTVARSDEIGDLARALAALSERLAETVGELERFAADLAHELKNPLAAIRSAAELAAEVDDPAERQRLKAIAEREVGRAERLLSELAAWAALEREERGSEPRATAIAPLLARLAEGWTRRRPGVEVRLAGEPPAARAPLEESRLARILENLLDNAVSLAPDGSAVEIAARAAGGAVEIEVADRGPGIPEEHRERIFERFFSWRPQEEEETNHLGLGLDIARSLARRAGGELVAENRSDGPGARFRLRLPAA
jgi:two-component system sensor histidine kinase ChvG